MLPLGFFAAAITEEKEDMTLGLLKMADVNPLALLIGKSAPRLVMALILLTAQLPFTMLAVTLGGVSLAQVIAAYTCLFAYLVLCAFMGLFYSVICLRSRGAGFLTGLTLFLYFFGTWITQVAIIPAFEFYGGPLYDRLTGAYSSFAGLLSHPPKAAEVAANLALTKSVGVLNTCLSWIVSTSAYTRLWSILQPVGFSDPAISRQVIWNFVFAGGFLLLAWLLFERCTQNEKPASEGRGLLMKRVGVGGKLFGSGRSWGNALAWKDFNFVGGGKTSMLVKYVLYGGIAFAIIWSNRRWNSQFSFREFGSIAMSIGLFAFCVETAIQASRVFYTETKWKTLSSIVLLPQPISTVAYAKVVGAAISLIPALSLIVIGAICAPKVFGDALESTLTEPAGWWGIGMFLLFIHTTALLSLYLKWGALPITFAVVYGGNILMMTFMSLLTMGAGGPNSFDGFAGLMALGSFGLCIIIQFWIGRRLEQMAAM